MGQILLVGQDWKARALLRAQLIEEGLDVEAHETVREALASLESNTPLPALLLADLSASDDPSGDLDLLSRWSGKIAVWVIGSLSQVIDGSLKGRGFQMILFRPIDMGELVEQIKLRVEQG